MDDENCLKSIDTENKDTLAHNADPTVSDNEDGARIKQLFVSLDVNNSGQLGKAEFQQGLSLLGFEFTITQVQELLDELGIDAMEGLGYNEFEQVMTHKLDNRQRHEAILDTMPLFDMGCRDRGYITEEDLKAVADMIGDRLKPEELQQMMAYAGVDKTGQVNSEDFVKIFRKYEP